MSKSKKFIDFYVCNSDGFVFYTEGDFRLYEYFYEKLDGKDGFHVGLFGKYCFIYRCNKKCFDE